MARLSKGLKKTKDSFRKRLFMAFSARALDEKFYSEIEDALILSDVGVATTTGLIDELKDEVFSRKITSPQQAKDLLKELILSEIDYEIPPFSYPLILLLCGVNGVGKTTAIGKLSNLFKNEGKSVVVAAADTFRAAASEQLAVWAKRSDVRLVRHSEGSDSAAVVFDALSSAKARQTDVVLMDTAGRLHNKKNLMEELKKICRVVEREMPHADFRKYLVLDATTGQNGLVQADIFAEAVELDGIVLTKLDGTAKGGVVVAISNSLSLPVIYAGVGEGIDDLIDFDASEFVSELFD